MLRLEAAEQERNAQRMIDFLEFYVPSLMLFKIFGISL